MYRSFAHYFVVFVHVKHENPQSSFKEMFFKPCIGCNRLDLIDHCQGQEIAHGFLV